MHGYLLENAIQNSEKSHCLSNRSVDRENEKYWPAARVIRTCLDGSLTATSDRKIEASARRALTFLNPNFRHGQWPHRIELK